MNKVHFQTQIERLVRVFEGGNSEKAKALWKERGELLWREVKDLSDYWMTKTVDHFIGSLRQAPLLTDFREEISKEQEKSYQIEKNRYREDAKAFWNGSYQPDDVKMLIQMNIKRAQGRVSDEEWQQHMRLINQVAQSSDDLNQSQYCSECDDSGLIPMKDKEDREWLYRCRCLKGNSRKQFPHKR